MLPLLVLACGSEAPPGGDPSPTPARPSSASAERSEPTTAFPRVEHAPAPVDAPFPTLALLDGENRPGRPFARRFLSSRQGVPPGPVALPGGDGLVVELAASPAGELVLELELATTSVADGRAIVRGLDARGAERVLGFPFQTRAGVETVVLPLWQHATGLRIPYIEVVPDTQGRPATIRSARLRAPRPGEREAPQWVRRDGISLLARFVPAASSAVLDVPAERDASAAGPPRLVHFAWATAPAESDLRLVVRGRDAHGAIAMRWTAPQQAGEGWNDVSFHLPPTVARLEFESAPRLPGGAFLSAVRILRPRLDAPDVFVLTGDTLRADHLGTYGSVVTSTERLDALATGSVVWERAFSVSNATNPAHASLFTSLYAKDHGVHDNRTSLDDAATTLAELLADAGYRTFAVTAARHIGPRVANLAQGIDRIADCDEWIRSGTEVVDEATRLLPLDAREPLFAWIHFFDPHTPYQPPAPFDRRYYDGDPEVARDEPLPEPFRRELVEPFPVRDAHFPRAQYRAEVDYLDHEVGRLLDLLSRRDRPRVLLFVGDHGESLGEHGNYFNHRGLFPHNLHVPCLLEARGRLTPGRFADPISTIDLLPTLCDLLDLPLPSAARGTSLLPALRGVGAPSPVFAEHAHELSAGFLDGTRFHVLHRRDATDASRTFEIRAGTFETLVRNDAPHREERTWPTPPPPALLEHLERWCADRRPFTSPAAPLTPTERDDLERLGYTK